MNTLQVNHWNHLPKHVYVIEVRKLYLKILLFQSFWNMKTFEMNIVQNPNNNANVFYICFKKKTYSITLISSKILVCFLSCCDVIETWNKTKTTHSLV